MDPSTQELIKAALMALLRHGLTTAGGALVSYGVFGADQQSSFVTIASGIIAAGAGYLLSVWQKKGFIGIMTDIKTTSSRLARVPPVAPDVPHAAIINDAIAAAKKAA